MGTKNDAKSPPKKKSWFIGSIFIHADRFDMWLMLLGLIGSIGSGLNVPIAMSLNSRLMNNIGSISTLSPDVFLRNINKFVLVYVCLACGSFLANFLAGYFWTRTSERQSSKMRVSYLKAVLRQDVAYFDLHVASMSEIITSVSDDSSVLQGVISEKVPNLLENASSFVLLWRLAIVTVPFVVLLVIPGMVYGRLLMSIARKMRREYNVAGAIAEQALSSVRTVYSFVGESKTVKEFSEALEGSLKLGLRQGFVKGLAMGSRSINFAIWSFVSYYSSTLVMNHGTKGGTVFAAGLLMILGGVALGSAMANFVGLSEACSSAASILEILKRVPKIDSDNLEGEKLENVSGAIEFSHVDFAYPSRPNNLILKDFILNVQPGEKLALVGRSGSGKSTVIALLQRFYDHLGGDIRLDGVSIDRLQLKWLRSLMGLVSQEPSLFATTIRENILFGKEDADMDEVVEAAKASNAHEFISKFPLGYDTQVGERGIQMSGGQKQRIAIARAILKSPRILLLDEATSALDSESERIVQGALDNASIDRTTIVVAHRLSTIQNADTISVVQDGQVMEKGSHDELISHPDGLYTSLVRLQHSHRRNDKLSMSLESGNTSSQRLSAISQKRSSQFARVNSFHVEDVVDPCKETKVVESPSFWRLLAMNRPEWKQASVGCVSAAMFGGVQAVHSVVLGSMISIFFLKNHDEIKEKTRNYSLFFAGLAVFSFVISIIQHYNFAYMGEYLTKRVREKMLAKILTFEVGWFDQNENSTGAVCSRLAKDANVVRSLVGDRMSLIVETVSAVAVASTLGLVIAWRLALVMIAIQPLTILCFYTRRVLLRNTLNKGVKCQDESSKLAAEAVSNLRTVTAFSSQKKIIQMLEAAQEAPRKESARQSWHAGLGLGFSQSIVNCTTAFTFWYAGKLIAQGLLSSKAMFQTYCILISTGIVIAYAGSMTSDLAKGADAVASFFKVVDRDTEIDPQNPGGHRPEEIKGLVELLDVNFSYPARPDVAVFEGFSMKIEAGKSTALVGQSGSGKSTVIGMIERFYEPLKGVVKIDGRDIRSYHLQTLRRHLALVSQEPALFAGTIKYNIAYGASGKVSEAEIMEAAKAANAHDFVAGLKEGYDTFCGNKGVQLSGGQKQRIAIARAILKNPAILLLDEATSALDSESEAVVQEALDHVMVGRTSVVVAHRLSTIRNCDTIAVLDKGKLVETGSHSALLAKGSKGAYYSLVNR